MKNLFLLPYKYNFLISFLILIFVDPQFYCRIEELLLMPFSIKSTIYTPGLTNNSGSHVECNSMTSVTQSNYKLRF